MKTLVKPYQDLQLYHFDTCPYCVKTRQIINNLNINLTMKNIRTNPKQGIELKKEVEKFKFLVFALKMQKAQFNGYMNLTTSLTS